MILAAWLLALSIDMTLLTLALVYMVRRDFRGRP